MGVVSRRRKHWTTLSNGYVAGSIPAGEQIEKEKTLVVTDIEILQCVERGVPGDHCRDQKIDQGQEV